MDRGGSVVLAGIHMSQVPALDHQRHLFLERNLRTVTANTRRDGEELLALAARLGIRPHLTTYPFERADEALRDIARRGMGGSAVVTFD
ncbi:hypothetical protein [Nocardioides sp. zg-DK7169]|uniref:hypothetical protein n=1 Tax=Nocardioides sp. zg-DK7169 TaxID=2736600 RepID=UPI0015538772|nr:hypothetical protein [Nocardioides sp. zg-DK7169]NPC96859.1 hypothetical protein [Nocardioides sp. zg-DK7169]